jgi:hypothetical protein
VLRSGDARARLLDALGTVDRLVLLGDVVELRHGPVRDAVGVAAPVLAAIGAALGPGREVVIVPGNHDHHLLDRWLERRARTASAPPLGVAAEVDWRDGELLGEVARRLVPADVRVAYPGVWLRDDVYATHGHYLDLHTTVPALERLAAGAMARLVREPQDGAARAEDYEAILAPIYAWIHARAQYGRSDLGRTSHGPSARAWRALSGGGHRRSLRRRALVASFPLLVAGLNRARLGPLRADVSGPEVRRASLRAFAEVATRLGIGASQIVFGHTHRAGPLPEDDHAEWRTASGARLLNSGSWVHEPGYLGPEPHRSPYRAGFQVTIDDHGPARLGNLLDRVSPAVPA